MIDVNLSLKRCHFLMSTRGWAAPLLLTEDNNTPSVTSSGVFHLWVSYICYNFIKNPFIKLLLLQGLWLIRILLTALGNRCLYHHPYFTDEKLRDREVTWAAWGHRARQWWHHCSTKTDWLQKPHSLPPHWPWLLGNMRKKVPGCGLSLRSSLTCWGPQFLIFFLVKELD